MRISRRVSIFVCGFGQSVVVRPADTSAHCRPKGVHRAEEHVRVLKLHGRKCWSNWWHLHALWNRKILANFWGDCLHRLSRWQVPDNSSLLQLHRMWRRQVCCCCGCHYLLIVPRRHVRGAHGSSVLPVLPRRHVLGWGECRISDELLWYALHRGEVRAGWGYIGIGSLLIVSRRHVRGANGSSALLGLPRRNVLGWGWRHVLVELLWYALHRREVRADWGYIGIGSDLLIVPRRQILGGLHASNCRGRKHVFVCIRLLIVPRRHALG
jgi:hypothetical protein